jgi:chromosome segregation ATPase
MSDYYTESQMQRIEQAAYDGAMLEAGKEWERQRYEFDAAEAELAERIIELEAEVTKCHELQDSYCDRIAELEAENNRLAELLHNEKSQLEIATDLGNKRWVALGKIYKDGEKHNTNWCKRIAQEGLGIKNERQ